MYLNKKNYKPIMSFEEWYQAVYEASTMGVDAGSSRTTITAEGVMTRATCSLWWNHGSLVEEDVMVLEVDDLRKLIPNEVARVAEVAAPFVAPFNPLAAWWSDGWSWRI